MRLEFEWADFDARLLPIGTSVFEDAEHELAEEMSAVVPRRRRAVEPA